MKKFFALTLSIITLSLAAVSVEAKTPAPQFGRQMERGRQFDRHRGRDWDRDRGRGRGWDHNPFNHRVRTFTETNFSRIGRRFYRDTYLITVFPNGRTQRRLISRVQVR